MVILPLENASEEARMRRITIWNWSWNINYHHHHQNCSLFLVQLTRPKPAQAPISPCSVDVAFPEPARVVSPQGLPSSLAKLKEEAHANRLAIQQQLVEGKGTEEAYRRHIKNYLSFWSGFQDHFTSGRNVKPR